MSYEILQVAKSDAFLLRSREQPNNTLEIPTLRDLLLLRTRLDRYIDNLVADGVTEAAPLNSADADPTPRDMISMISVSQAFAIAEAQGYTIPPTSLKSAVYRRSIPGAVQQGTRWKIPRAAFEAWLQQWAASQ